MRLIPSFSFAFGIINMSNISVYKTLDGLKYNQSVFDFNISGGDILMLGIEGFVYLILVFVIEILEGAGHIQKLGSKEESI